MSHQDLADIRLRLDNFEATQRQILSRLESIENRTDYDASEQRVQNRHVNELKTHIDELNRHINQLNKHVNKLTNKDFQVTDDDMDISEDADEDINGVAKDLTFTFKPRGSAARDQVFGIVELARAILKNVPPRDLLLSQRVCRRFKEVIDGSKVLQRCLFFLPQSPDDQPRLNEMFLTRKVFNAARPVVNGDKKRVFFSPPSADDSRHVKLFKASLHTRGIEMSEEENHAFFNEGVDEYEDGNTVDENGDDISPNEDAEFPMPDRYTPQYSAIVYLRPGVDCDEGEPIYENIKVADRAGGPRSRKALLPRLTPSFKQPKKRQVGTKSCEECAETTGVKGGSWQRMYIAQPPMDVGWTFGFDGKAVKLADAGQTLGEIFEIAEE